MCISDWSSDVCSSDLATWSRTELRKLPLHERRKDPFMETIGLGCYFEDLPVGRKFKTIGRTVTDADITNFVNATGMVEVLFTNIEFLRERSEEHTSELQSLMRISYAGFFLKKKKIV